MATCCRDACHDHVDSQFRGFEISRDFTTMFHVWCFFLPCSPQWGITKEGELLFENLPGDPVLAIMAALSFSEYIFSIGISIFNLLIPKLRISCDDLNITIGYQYSNLKHGHHRYRCRWKVSLSYLHSTAYVTRYGGKDMGQHRLW